MYCKQCGVKLKEGTSFCMNCGTKVTIKPDQPNYVGDGPNAVEKTGVTNPIKENREFNATTEEINGVSHINEEAMSGTNGNAEMNQPINQSVNQPMNQPTNQPINQGLNQQSMGQHAPYKANQPSQVMPNPNVTQSVPKKKSKAFLIVAVFAPILLIVALGVFGYFSNYMGQIDFDSMIGKVDKEWHIYQNRSYEPGDDAMILEIETEVLNGYINERNVLKDIQAGDLKVSQICFDERSDYVYFEASNGGSDVHITANYTMTLEDDQLVLDVSPSSIGMNIPIFSTLALAGRYDVDTIIIPLSSEMKNFDDAYIKGLLQSMSAKGSVSKGTIEVTYELEGALMSDNAKAMSEITFKEPEISGSGDEQFIEIKQDYLASSVLLNESLQSALSTKEIDGTYYVDQNNRVVLRLKDKISGASYDVALNFDYNYEADSISLTSAAYLNQMELNDSVKDILLNAFADGLNGLSVGLSDQYDVKDITVSQDSVKLFVDQMSWTVMVYLNGSDLESYYYSGYGLSGMASDDLDEMMAGVTTDNVNVVVETGGTLEWRNPSIDPSQNQRWLVQEDGLVHLEDLGQKNMCDPATLEDFLGYGVTNYPAENYALVFWNHGGGAIYGFGADEYYYYDSLTLNEMQTALQNAETANNFKLEVIGFDACLMATLETAVALEPYAKYMIASEETEPDYGWDYTYIFNELAEGRATDGENFGEIVVEGFREDSVDKDMEDLLTLSVIDLSKTSGVVNTFDVLINELSSSADGISLLNGTIPGIKAFGGNTESSGYTDHYDLEHFAKNMIEFWPNEANELIEAIDDAVLYKFSGYLATEAGGLSFYVPYYDLYSETDIMGMYAPVAVSDTYRDFAEAFYDYRDANQYTESTLGYYVNYDVDPYEITFDEATYEELDYIYLNAYEVLYDDYGYYYLDLGYDAWVYQSEYDYYTYEDGFGRWAAIDGQKMPLWVTYDSENYIEYETPIYHNGQPAMLITAYVYEDDEYFVYGARPYNEDESGVVDRNIIEFQPGDEIVMLYDLYDDYGGYELYESEPIIVGDIGIPIIEEIPFESGYEYGIQFVLVDIYGNVNYTEYVGFTLE